MEIIKMNGLNEAQLEAAAKMLTEELPLGWPTLADAFVEIDELLIPENTMLAVVEGEEVLAWGGILRPEYAGHVIELHPLVVRGDKQRQGIGRKLVMALEDEARKQGALTLFLGADDEVEGGETSLSNVDLYADLPTKLAHFDPGTHQSAFYLKQGFKVVGVLPDADGRGKPDILMAKRL